MVRTVVSFTAATLLAIVVFSGGLVPGGPGDPPVLPEPSEYEHERYAIESNHSREAQLQRAERAYERLLR